MAGRTKKSLGFFLHTPKSALKGFSRQADANYYSQPRKVEVISTNPTTGLITVREPIYGVFPCSPETLIESFEWV